MLVLSFLVNCKKEALKVPPTVTISEASNITANSATVGSIITADGGSEVLSRGVVWSTSDSPISTDSKTSDGKGIGSYSSSLTSLSPGTTYNLRSYAINSIGTAYSSQKSFKTLALLATLSTTEASAITSNSVNTGGNITNDGGAEVTARGVCWNTTQNPTITDNKTSDSSGSGIFTSSVTGLTPGTIYYLRSYSTNSIGTAYGSQITIVTLAVLPTVTTTDITSITSISATGGGNVTNDGGAAISARGVCWSTSQNPTIADKKTTDGSGKGIFPSSITGLTPGVTYYIKAYAINSVGTAYGAQITTTATPVLPTLTTSEISSISGFSAISGGNITSNGGVQVSSRGVCWSTSQDPTISNSKSIDGTGNGVFVSSLNGLVSGTTYFVRAYATNSIGTAYGNAVTFKTVQPSTLSDIKPTGLIPSTDAELDLIPSISTLDLSLIPSLKNAAIIPSSHEFPIPSVADQGTQNSCVGFAFGYGMMSQIFKIYNGLEDYFGQDRLFSPHYIWNQLNDGKNQGVSYAKAMNLLKSQGCCTLTDMDLNSSATDQPSAKAKMDAANNLITEYYKFTSSDIDNGLMKEYLSKNYPIAVGLSIDGGFQLRDKSQFERQSDGRLVWKAYKDNSRNGHALLICGYDDAIHAYKVLNSWGTEWGNDGIFWLDYDFFKTAVQKTFLSFQCEAYTAIVKRPLLSTDDAAAVNSNAAQCAGNVTFDWQYPVSSKGFCYSLMANPTILDNKTNDGSGIGTYTHTLTGLDADRMYYVKAYAINSQGVSYGYQRSFITTKLQSLPSITTSSASSITSSSASSGGNISSDGGANVTARGVCWSTSNSPTISNIKTIDGSGTGSFSSSINGLSAGVVYYVRAYATNSFGTGYGNAIPFTTQQIAASSNPEALWTFDNCTANDISGNNHNGLYYGAVPTCQSGISSNSEYFSNASLSYFDSPWDLSIESTSFTISFWVKFQQGTTFSSSSGNPFFTLETGDSNSLKSLLFYKHYNSSNPSSSSWAVDTWQNGFFDLYSNSNYNTLINGSWHHFALSCVNTNVTLYMDGSILSNFISPSSKYHRIMAQADPQNNTSFDQIRFYKIALSASQIQNIYTNKN